MPIYGKEALNICHPYIASLVSMPVIKRASRPPKEWSFREGTFFLGGGGGEGWGILVFFPKKVLALPCVLIKKLLTPHL